MEIKKVKKEMKEVETLIECYDLCDKCDKRIITSGYDAFDCELIHKTGNSYPEGGQGELETMTLCKLCAVECIDLLEANGFRIIKSEWDF